MDNFRLGTINTRKLDAFLKTATGGDLQVNLRYTGKADFNKSLKQICISNIDGSANFMFTGRTYRKIVKGICTQIEQMQLHKSTGLINFIKDKKHG